MKIALVGCGKMGSALLQGWLKADIADQYFVIDPSPLPDIFQGHEKIEYHSEVGPFLTGIDSLVLAVKPQKADDIVKKLRILIGENTVLISVAAGKTITGFQDSLGPAQPIIRTMPNTPAAVGKGMTAMICSASCNDTHKENANALMQCCGETILLEDEGLFDAITAISGSGPAYLFYLCEVLSEAGRKAGLPKDIAQILARQTIIGSSALMEQDDRPASDLRKQVTSPGGTTAAALDILMNGEIQRIFDDALRAAAGRSRELNN